MITTPASPRCRCWPTTPGRSKRRRPAHVGRARGHLDRADRHRAGVGVARGSLHLPPDDWNSLKESPPSSVLHGLSSERCGNPSTRSGSPPFPMLQRSGSTGGGGDGGGRTLGEVTRRILRDLQGQAGRHHPAGRFGLPAPGHPLPLLRQQPLPGVPGSHRRRFRLHRNDAAARARTESLARRLKTVADPTRLALLHYLAGTPSTVGDLAASFGLAQPTVSMHMKSLRESGLVRSERKDGRMQLSADPRRGEHGRRAAGRGLGRAPGPVRRPRACNGGRRVGGSRGDRPPPATGPSSPCGTAPCRPAGPSRRCRSRASEGASRTRPRRAWSWRTRQSRGTGTPASASRAAAFAPGRVEQTDGHALDSPACGRGGTSVAMVTGGCRLLKRLNSPGGMV